MADSMTSAADAADAVDARPADDETDLLIAFLARRNEPCPACGYDLRMMRSPQCPECGVALELRLHFRERGFRGWLASVVMTALSVGMTAFVAIMFGISIMVEGPPYGSTFWRFLFSQVAILLIAGAYLTFLVRRRHRIAANEPGGQVRYVVAAAVLAVAPIAIAIWILMV